MNLALPAPIDDLPPLPNVVGNAKLQRWIDIIASLLDRRAPATFEEIAHDVPAYRSIVRGHHDLPEAEIVKTRKDSLKRMFERDKDELRELGIPIESRADADGNENGAYILRRNDFYLPYLSLAAPDGSACKDVRDDRYGYRTLSSLILGPDALAAIVDAAAVVRALGDPLLAADVDRALRKLAVDLPLDAVSAEPEPTILLPQMRPSNAVFETLSDALRRRKSITFEYHALSTNDAELRAVSPYGLFFAQGHWYLVAHDHARKQLRNFRLNRISKAKCNAMKHATPDYEIPVTFRLRDHATSRYAWELGDDDAMSVMVRLRGASGSDLAAAQCGERVNDDTEQRRFSVRRLDVFVRWLISTAGGLEPIAPATLILRYRDTVALIATLYAAGRVAPGATAAGKKFPIRARGVADRWEPKGAAAQLQRLLQLVPALADECEHEIDAVAAQVGSDASTVLKDVYSLVERYDAPGGFVERVQLYLESGRISARTNHFLRPMRLTLSELSALALGLTVLRRRRTLTEHEVIDRARTQLLAIVAKLPDDPIPVMPYAVVAEDSVRSDVLGQFRAALQHRHKASITYRGSAETVTNTRVICIYALTMASGMLYAVAFCEREKALRIFRLDRVEHIELTDVMYEIPSDFSVDSHIQSGRLFHGVVDRKVAVRYSPTVARWIAEREGVVVDADGALVLEYPLADDEWAMRHVLQYGVEAEILAPAELRDALRARLSQMGKAVT